MVGQVDAPTLRLTRRLVVNSSVCLIHLFSFSFGWIYPPNLCCVILHLHLHCYLFLKSNNCKASIMIGSIFMINLLFVHPKFWKKYAGDLFMSGKSSCDLFFVFQILVANYIYLWHGVKGPSNDVWFIYIQPHMINGHFPLCGDRNLITYVYSLEREREREES